MIGAFIQVNDAIPIGGYARQPVGYVICENGCWEWVGFVNRGGYAKTWDRRTKTKVYAHRHMYEKYRGAIPEGLQIDHVCRNTKCVNPWHLEVVTCRENLLRGDTLTAHNASKTRCIHGHEYTPENTGKNSGGWRICLACRREWDRRRYYRLKAASE